MLIPLGFLDFPTGVAGSYDLLQTEILTSSQSSLTFSSLGDYASDYQHLQIRALVRVSESTASRGLQLQINGDTGSNYSNHGLYGNGSSVQSFSNASASNIFFNRATGSSATSGAYGGFVMDILDPFETTKYTTIRVLGGIGGVRIDLGSGLWQNTAALNALEYGPEGLATSFVAGSRFSLYGLKASA